MRLAVLSDLHLEKRPLATVGLPRDFDVLVCAGDVWEGEPERGVAALAALADGRPVILVPGNHERYRSQEARHRSQAAATAPAMLSRLHDAAAAVASLTVLANGARTRLCGVDFVGATLWSDFALAGLWRPDLLPEAALAAAIAAVTGGPLGSREYRDILAASGRPWQPADARAAHADDRAAFARGLAGATAPVRVAVSHHPPLTQPLEPWRDVPGVPWWLPAFYASTALSDLPADLRPELWLFGHFHAAFDAVVGGTRCVANPVAAADYDGGLVVEVGG